MIGTSLGPFRIDRRLGAGGMGEVYLATDTRLGRRVAVKVLAPDLTGDASRRQRFEREARAVSHLSHPHVCALYDVGREGEIDYLVMELVEGRTLADRLAGGPLELDEALRFGVQIADALAAAHRKGIVHRDLKPGNVMITDAGVKLLDFGLAKLLADEWDAGARQTALPTASDPLTEKGTLLGTYPYMAPEQLEGREADARSDIFAFGALLYEMLTGERAFTGSSRASLIGAILHKEPAPLAERQPLTPPALERVVRKCLAKDPEARWQSAQDLRDEVEWVAGEGASAVPGPPLEAPRRRWQSGLGWTLAALLAVALAGALLAGLRGGVERPATWVAIPPPEGVVELGMPALSADGRSLAFEARGIDGTYRLWLRSLGAAEARPLPGTEEASMPFFAPDGRALGFFAGGALKTLDLASGRIATVAEGTRWAAAGAWAGEGAGVILFSPGLDGGLRRVAGSGGPVVEVTTLDDAAGEHAHAWPHFLPDGHHFLYVVLAGPAPGIYLGSLDKGSIERLVPIPRVGGTGVAYSPSGHLLYLLGGTLMAQPFDLGGLRVTGDPVRLAEGVSFWGPGFAAFAVSREGGLVFREDSGWPLWQPVWLDRAGRDLGPAGPAGPIWDRDQRLWAPSLSPDGGRMAVSRREPKAMPQIWIHDLRRGTATPFAAGLFDAAPVWAPDGDRLVWGRVADDPPQLYLKALEGGGEPERLTTQPPPVQRWPLDWSSSGRYILYSQQSPAPTGWDLFLLDLEVDDSRSRPYLATTANERVAAISPDERHLAYVSDLSGREEVYLGGFPEHGRRWQVSKAGGTDPWWSPDGRTLHFREPGGAVLAVLVDESPDGLSLTDPEILFRHDGFVTGAPGGERFLALRKEADAPLEPFTLVLDWPQELR